MKTKKKTKNPWVEKLVIEPATAKEIQDSLNTKEKNKGVRHPICACGIPGIRSDVFDAYYCPKCATWLEKACGDSECSFCSQRPKHPCS